MQHRKLRWTEGNTRLAFSREVYRLGRRRQRSSSCSGVTQRVRDDEGTRGEQFHKRSFIRLCTMSHSVFSLYHLRETTKYCSISNCVLDKLPKISA